MVEVKPNSLGSKACFQAVPSVDKVSVLNRCHMGQLERQGSTERGAGCRDVQKKEREALQTPAATEAPVRRPQGEENGAVVRGEPRSGYDGRGHPGARAEEGLRDEPAVKAGTRGMGPMGKVSLLRVGCAPNILEVEESHQAR